jgi:hypothetical protein
MLDIETNSRTRKSESRRLIGSIGSSEIAALSDRPQLRFGTNTSPSKPMAMFLVGSRCLETV